MQPFIKETEQFAKVLNDGYSSIASFINLGNLSFISSEVRFFVSGKSCVTSILGVSKDFSIPFSSASSVLILPTVAFSSSSVGFSISEDLVIIGFSTT
jgi:hypothetical protein